MMTETNQGLEAQTDGLRESQILLERQQEDLQQANQALEARARQVSRQMVEAARAALQNTAKNQQQDMKAANRELEERARLVAEQKAEAERARAALQLSKIQSGTMAVEMAEVSLAGPFQFDSLGARPMDRGPSLRFATLPSLRCYGEDAGPGQPSVHGGLWLGERGWMP